jgi:cytochrome P450
VSDAERVARIEKLLARRTLRNIPILPDFRYSRNGRRVERARRRYEEIAGMLDAVEPRLRLPLAAALAHAFDAVTALAGWTVERLLRNEDALAAMRADLEAGSEAYLDAAVVETLRVRPIVLSLPYRLVADRRVCGHELAAGTLVRLAIGIAHLPQSERSRPMTFEPERLLDPGERRPPPLAFGAGAARCGGQDWAIGIARAIVRELVLAVDMQRTIDPPELSRFRRPHRMLTPANKARAVLEDRPATRP